MNVRGILWFRRLKNRGFLINEVYPYLILVAIALPALVLRLDAYPPAWYDEGFRTNAAWTLAEHGVYGTYTTDGYHPFDPSSTSGPLDIIAVAVSFKIFGTGLFQARFPIVLFTLIAILGLYAVSVYAYGREGGLFSVLVVLAMPAIQGVGVLLLGRQVMSEVPALAMIVLGLCLWFRSWESERSLLLSILAGCALGLGILSKTQVAIALLPALVLVATLRGLKNSSQFLKLFIPVIIILGVMASWRLLEYITTPDLIRQSNNAVLSQAIQTLLVTDLFGRNLSRTSIVLFIVIMLGAGTSGWRLLGAPRDVRLGTNAQWAEATLALFALFSGLWFAFISIGWPRYAFMGLVASLMLLGKLGWDIFHRVCQFVEKHIPGISHQAYVLVLSGLAVLAIVTNCYPALCSEGGDAVHQVADFIRTNISQDATIESWEWELDVLSKHKEYHHPDQKYQFLAIRQLFHNQTTFGLNYDVLQADPDYLVTGVFSDWTNIYGDPAMIGRHFTQLIEVVPYRVYKRNR